jgi:hypothetical protein
MTSKSYREDGYHAMIKETTYRTIVSTKDAPASTVYAIDIEKDDELVIAHSQTERTRHSTLGSGTRNANQITEFKAPPVEESMDLILQVAKFLYLTMGGCVTTGTSTGETGTVSSGQGTAALVLSGGGAFGVNAFAGYMLTITSGTNSGNKYHIVSNTADTVTIDKTSPADINTDGYRIDGPPFTHTISEAQTPPSFAIHQELENATDANSIRLDLLGCIMNGHTANIETEGSSTQTIDFIGSKTVTGADIARPTETDAIEELKWCGVITNTMTYNSVDEFLAADPDSISIEIANNAKLKPAVGDCYAPHPVFGERDYTITVHIYPESIVLFELQGTPITDFLSDLVYIMKISAIGGSHMTPITDTVASGGGTTVLTVTSGGLSVDAHIHSYLVVTAGDNVGATYLITDNDATTVTLNTVTPSSIDGDSVEIKYPNDIKYTFNKLYVDDGPASYSSKDDRELEGDYVFKLTGAGTCAIVSHDKLGIAHYEGST